MKITILYIVLFLSVTSIYAQKKLNVSFDNSYWIKYNTTIEKKLNLKDLKQTKEDFYVRISYAGIKIDIWKDSLNQSKGLITNYIFHNKDSGKSTDTIIRKIILRQTEADSLYDLINTVKILELPTDKEIKGWVFGLDGITYDIEYADKNSYWYKSYWTPTSQDSLKEGLLVTNFVKKINAILNLENKNRDFVNDLPGGSYSNGSGIVFTKPYNQSFNLYLVSNSRLPIGILASYWQNKIKKKSIKSGITLIYNSDLNDSYSFKGLINKYDVLLKNKKLFSDAITFDYKIRKLHYTNQFSEFQNYNLQYSLNVNKYGNFSIGYDYLKQKIKIENGISLNFSKQIKFIDTYISANYTYYNPSLYNYEFGISRYIETEWELLPRVYVQLNYEKLFDFKGLNFTVIIPIIKI